MRFALFFAAAAALAACSQPAEGPETKAPSAPPAVAACNDLAPDTTRLVEVRDGDATATPAAELRGGSIAPGVYDLTGAARIGAATGWREPRAVALRVAESDDGVVLNWAGSAPGGPIDTWTATLRETPSVRLSYTCGRIGDVEAAFSAQADRLELRVQDGASGALSLTFARRP